MKFATAGLLALVCFAALGCGGQEPPPSGDEIASFLEENPDVVEATNRANAAENFEDEGF